MSVLDQFRTAEEQVAKRLRELKPLVAEYHELEQVAQRLGLSVSGDDATVSSEPQPAARKSARRRRRASASKARSAPSAREGISNGGSTRALSPA